MTKIALAGDWHGHLQWQKAALHTLGRRGDIEVVLHAGDYGVGWPGNWPDFVNSAESVLRKYNMYLYVTPGNHENWDWINTREYDDTGMHWMTNHACLLRRNAFFDIPYDDGKSRLVHSLGGAASIDYQFRNQGISWWKEEMLTYGDVIRARAIGEENDVDIMVTHDAPDGGTDRVQRIIDNPDFSMWTVQGLAYAAQGRAMMNHAVAGVKPKVFVHGHFHAADMKQTDETLWVSLGCNRQADNLAVLDLETLKAEFIQLDPEMVEEYLTR